MAEKQKQFEPTRESIVKTLEGFSKAQTTVFTFIQLNLGKVLEKVGEDELCMFIREMMKDPDFTERIFHGKTLAVGIETTLAEVQACLKLTFDLFTIETDEGFIAKLRCLNAVSKSIKNEQGEQKDADDPESI